MTFNKIVYFENQEVVEYWEYSDSFGFNPVPYSVGQGWKDGTFNYIVQTCSQELFDTRLPGGLIQVPW